eukprot:1201944-Rhodomonas_salina.2
MLKFRAQHPDAQMPVPRIGVPLYFLARRVRNVVPENATRLAVNNARMEQQVTCLCPGRARPRLMACAIV